MVSYSLIQFSRLNVLKRTFFPPGIPDAEDVDDDNDGIADTVENMALDFAVPKICHDPAVDNSEEMADSDDDDDDVKCYEFGGEAIELRASIDERSERDDVEECIYPLGIWGRFG